MNLINFSIINVSLRAVPVYRKAIGDRGGSGKSCLEPGILGTRMRIMQQEIEMDFMGSVTMSPASGSSMSCLIRGKFLRSHGYFQENKRFFYLTVPMADHGGGRSQHPPPWKSDALCISKWNSPISNEMCRFQVKYMDYQVSSFYRRPIKLDGYPCQ